MPRNFSSRWRAVGNRGLAVIACIAVFVFGFVPVVSAQGEPVERDARIDLTNGSQTFDPPPRSGDYIVVFHEQADKAAGWVERLAIEIAATHKAEISHIYTSALPGFAASFPGDISKVEANPLVDYVVEDEVGELADVQSPAPFWGLDRIDQRDLPLNEAYGYTNDGEDVHAYIIDTGIRATHEDFEDRVLTEMAFGEGDPEDCDGHGTHIAGIVGGRLYGVAKAVNLHSLKISNNCGRSTLTSDVIAAIDWVARFHRPPAVASIQWGVGPNEALDQAVEGVLGRGVTFVIAAGNGSGDACDYSPARVPGALTVGSSNRRDKVALSSETGPCVDLFAPGVDIVSAGIDNDYSIDLKSGTSMAAPHVAGVVALYLQDNRSAFPTEVQDHIVSTATTDVLSRVPDDTANLLLFAGIEPSLLCDGLMATHVGDDSDDDLHGTMGDDVIVGLGGDDELDGRWGDDVICGGPGNDDIDGDDGEDRLFGGDGDDKIKGGWKADIIEGGAGADTLKGGLNDDVIDGGPDNDEIYGGNGDDSLAGGDGNDKLRGELHDDDLDGGTGNDDCAGGWGDDTLTNC